MRSLLAPLIAVLSAIPLHAGFIGLTCTDQVSLDVCTAGNANISDTQGTTSYTYLASFTGQLVGGKPTLGTYAEMTVADPNGVPVLGSTMQSFAGVSFSDTVTAAPAAVYHFHFGLHVVNSANNFANGFHDVSSRINLLVTGYDSLNNVQWFTNNTIFVPVTVSASGTTTQNVTYSTPLGFFNGNIAKLGFTVGLSSTVYYANLAGTPATSVNAFSDSANTLSFNSIDAEDALGDDIPMTFTSSEGANYSNAAAVPEPATAALVCGALAALWTRRRLNLAESRR
jgi:hypothetical protein